MAERRSFLISIVESDEFYKLPLSTQALYFHIGLCARDKGFLNNIFAIAGVLGCTKDDVWLLNNMGYIKPIWDSNECQGWEIVHWYENNGIGETAKKRNNYKYREWRKEVISRDKKCVICNSKSNLQAHHIKSFAQFPLLRFNLENGITMCEVCHRKYHRKDRKNGEG